MATVSLGPGIRWRRVLLFGDKTKGDRHSIRRRRAGYQSWCSCRSEFEPASDQYLSPIYCHKVRVSTVNFTVTVVTPSPSSSLSALADSVRLSIDLMPIPCASAVPGRRRHQHQPWQRS